MRINRIFWLVPVFLYCFVLGVWSNDAIAAEEIKAPLLTGITWVKMSQDQKTGYIWGVGDIIDLEQEIMEVYPELKRESFVAKAVEGIGAVGGAAITAIAGGNAAVGAAVGGAAGAVAGGIIGGSKEEKKE